MLIDHIERAEFNAEEMRSLQNIKHGKRESQVLFIALLRNRLQ